MGMGFGSMSKRYVLFSEGGDVMFDDYADAYYDDGHTEDKGERVFNADNFPNRVEVAQVSSLNSRNGSTVYATQSREIALYIDNRRRMCESSSEYDEGNPMWTENASDTKTLLSSLVNNTFQTPVFKACQHKTEQQLIRFFQDLLSYFRNNPDEQFNCYKPEFATYMDFEKARINPDNY